MRRERNRRHPVHPRTCGEFVGTPLEAWARPALDGMPPPHRTLLGKGPMVRAIACSVNLDAARKREEPSVRRWDYVVVAEADRQRLGIGIEPHYAGDDPSVVIGKKEWAQGLLQRECPKLHARMSRWIWLVTSEPFPLTNHAKLSLASRGLEVAAAPLWR